MDAIQIGRSPEREIPSCDLPREYLPSRKRKKLTYLYFALEFDLAVSLFLRG
jgi:hypothetical protein